MSMWLLRWSVSGQMGISTLEIKLILLHLTKKFFSVPESLNIYFQKLAAILLSLFTLYELTFLHNILFWVFLFSAWTAFLIILCLGALLTITSPADLEKVRLFI